MIWAGGGITTGRVIGGTDRRGEDVTDRRVGPQDFLATIYQHLGIDYAEGHHPRPRRPPHADRHRRPGDPRADATAWNGLPLAVGFCFFKKAGGGINIISMKRWPWDAGSVGVRGASAPRLRASFRRSNLKAVTGS